MKNKLKILHYRWRKLTAKLFERKAFRAYYLPPGGGRTVLMRYCEAQDYAEIFGGYVKYEYPL